MAETVTLWFGNRKFFVSPKEIRSFKGLKIKISLDTEEKEVNGEKVISRKNYGITQVDLTAILNAFAGNDVQTEATGIISDCQYAREDYLYDAKGAKFWPFKLMLTEAEITTCEIGPKGKWTYAEVRMTFKQSTSWSGATAGSGDSNSSGGGGGGGGSDETEHTVVIVGGTYTVTASSLQAALTKALSQAGKTSYSGVAIIDGSSVCVEKGQIVAGAHKVAKKTVQTQKKAAETPDVDTK